jgi:hypothetical protein
VAKHNNITEPDSAGFQVRVVRNRKEYSRYFSHKLWGNRNRSLKAAISFRDQVQILVGDRRPIPLDNKSTGIIGVSRYLKYDKRRDVYSLVYSCNFDKNNKKCIKQFHVGLINQFTADEEFHAFRTAVHFRKEYELYKEAGKLASFSPEKYKLWKTEKIYE